MSTEHDPGMSRRQLIRHGAWFGAAVVLTVAGGEVISHVAGSTGAGAAQSTKPALRFAQVSDSHIGFNGPANPNVADTFTQAIGQINGLGFTPDFVIHTGESQPPCQARRRTPRKALCSTPTTGRAISTS